MRVPKPAVVVAGEPAHHRRVNTYRAELRCNAHVAQKYTHRLRALLLGRSARENREGDFTTDASYRRKLTFSRSARFHKTLSFPHIPHAWLCAAGAHAVNCDVDDALILTARDTFGNNTRSLALIALPAAHFDFIDACYYRYGMNKNDFAIIFFVTRNDKNIFARVLKDSDVY